MDYDDNDFQSQHFQLVGEDNLNFSTGLCSFALPKFDLDDQLQLRFDNLVEPDSLLGIRAHERNSWIDEFSAGSSVIEFTSSAAESCSIPRHKNVWSEATSTESVEMLLKAVGEDDMINKTTIDSDAVAVLDSTANQMDTCPTKSDSNMEEMICAEPSNVQIKCHDSNKEEMVCAESSDVPIEYHHSSMEDMVCAEPSNVQIESHSNMEVMVRAEPSNVQIECHNSAMVEMVCAEPPNVQTDCHHSNIEDVVCAEPSTVQIECHSYMEEMVHAEPSNLQIECQDSNMVEMVRVEPSDVQIQCHHSNMEDMVCAEPSTVQIECHSNMEAMVCAEPSNVLIECRDPNMQDMVSAEPSNVQIECHDSIPESEESAVNAPSDEATYQTQTVGMSADQNLVKAESLGVEMITVTHCNHGRNLPLSPVKFFEEDKEEFSEDKDYGETELDEKRQDHSHTPSDCSGGLARKNVDLRPSNTLMDLSLPASIKDVASADPGSKISDNQAGYSREVSQTESDVDPPDTDKLAHGSILIGSENSVDPDYGVNDPVFLMEDRGEEVVVKKSDGLLDVVVNQVKVFSAASQDNPFGELEDVCNLEVYSHEKKRRECCQLTFSC